MFLFLSFIVVVLAIYLFVEMASSYYYSEPNSVAVVALLIYSIVCLIKALKESGDSFLDDDYSRYNDNISNKYNRYNQEYNSWFNDDYPINFGANVNKPISLNKTEVFTPDKKEKNNDERPLVWHYPSKKEAREKIENLEKSFWWRVKRNLFSFVGIDITEKYYKPSYVKEEVAVKGKNEDDSRFKPKTNWFTQKENEEYNFVAKSLGRSCDIAFDGEAFMDEINTTDNDETK